MRIVITLAFLLVISVTSQAQNPLVTEFKEQHETSLALYFYPSTLRMINLQHNAEYDEMISEIKKARYLKLDSGAVTREEILSLSEKLLQDGYEEMMLMQGPKTDIRVLGLEKRFPEVVVISRSGYEYMILEVVGMINIAKIPKLVDTFNSGGFLDVFNLTNRKNDERVADHQ